MWPELDEVAESATLDDRSTVRASSRSRPEPTVAITNEVGLGVHPETGIGRRYRDVLGFVNQAWAEVADPSLLLVAGRATRLDNPWKHLT